MQPKGDGEMPKSARNASICLVAVLILFASSSPTTAQGTTLLVDNERVECPEAPFETISAAVAAAATGDTIEVCNGTYTEQITIAKSVTLKAGSGSGVTVRAPLQMAGLRAIIHVTGPVMVTIEGLTVSGPGLGFSDCNVIRSGIRIDTGAFATIRRNVIRDISGCGDGVGILVGQFAERTVATAIIDDNVIMQYEKAGIVVSNFGSSAAITNNKVLGRGATSKIVQNGIEVADGATAVVKGNDIRGHFFLNTLSTKGLLLCPSPADPSFSAGGCSGVTAAGILFFRAGSLPDEKQLSSQNSFHRNQADVVTF